MPCSKVSQTYAETINLMFQYIWVYLCEKTLASFIYHYVHKWLAIVCCGVGDHTILRELTGRLHFVVM